MSSNEKLLCRLFAFLTACIIAIVSIFSCGFSSSAYGGIVADDSIYYLQDIASIPDTFFDSSYFNDFVGYDSDLSNTYSQCLSQHLPFTLYSSNSYSTYEQYFSNGTGFVTFGSDSNMTSLECVLGSSGSVVCTDMLGNTYLCYTSYDNIPNHPNFGRPSILILGWGHSGAQNLEELASNTFRMQLDGVDYLAIPITQYIVNSSFDVYYVNSVVGGSGSYTSSSVAVSPNNPVGTTESAENNLYLKSFDIQYNVASLIGGYCTITGTPTKYQLEHPDQFTLCYSYTFNVNMVVNRIGGKKFNFTKTSSPYQIPFSQAISGNTITVNDSLKDIEQNIAFTGWNDGLEEWDNSIYDFFNYFGGYSGESVSEVQWQTCSVTCSAFVVSNQDSISDTLQNHSGVTSKTYNFLSGNQSYKGGNNITNNDNPYNFDDVGTVDNQTDVDLNNTTNHVTNDNIPTSSNTTTGTNNGGVTIYNNNTLNGGSGVGSSSGIGNTSQAGVGSSLVSSFFDTFNPLKMFFNAMIGDSEVVSEEIMDTIGANTFLTFVSDSFGFMPSSFWVSISTFFGACLVVLIIAFIFKVIISIL